MADPVYGYRFRKDAEHAPQAPEVLTERIGGPGRLEAARVQRVIHDVDDMLELLEKLFSADFLLWNYALFASPRPDAQPGRYFNPVIDGGDATTFSRFDMPSSTTVRFPTYSFGVKSNTAAAKRILLREENAMLYTLAHGTDPTGVTGFGPLLALFDYWLAPARQDLFDARPSCWFGLAENQVTNTALHPSDASFGNVLGITVGPTGNWFALYRKDPGGVFTQTDLTIAPVSEEFHRWTWVVTNRLANGGAGIAELYYDTIKVFEVPVNDLPAAAMFVAGAVGCPTDAASNEKGFRAGLLQGYHTRSIKFKPWD